MGTITAFFWKSRGYCALVTIECTITLAEAVGGDVVMIDGDQMPSPLHWWMKSTALVIVVSRLVWVVFWPWLNFVVVPPQGPLRRMVPSIQGPKSPYGYASADDDSTHNFFTGKSVI